MKNKKKNKKAFTMIELIVCIALLSLVVLIPIIFINKKDELGKKEKIKENIIATTDIFYTSNKDIQKKLQNNYGYYVLSIDTLKELGLLDERFVIPTKSDSDIPGADYTKIVIKNIQDLYMINDDAELGLIEYIYPYVPGTPFVANLDTLTIESFEIDDFVCTIGLDNGEIDYMNENYQISSTDKFKCATYSGSKMDINLNEDIDFDNGANLHLGENRVYYKITLENDKVIYGDRIISVNYEFTPTLTAKIKGTNTNYECNNWVNKDVTLSVNANKENLSFSNWKKNTIDLGDGINLDIEESGTYLIDYELKGKISEDSNT